MTRGQAATDELRDLSEPLRAPAFLPANRGAHRVSPHKVVVSTPQVTVPRALREGPGTSSAPHFIKGSPLFGVNARLAGPSWWPQTGHYRQPAPCRAFWGSLLPNEVQSPWGLHGVGSGGPGVHLGEGFSRVGWVSDNGGQLGSQDQ